MLLMKFVYKVERSGQEFTCNVLGKSPEEVARYLQHHHKVDTLDYFSLQRREEVHAIMPSIEKACYLKVRSHEEQGAQ